MTCSVPGCKRQRKPHYARCHSHVDRLIEAIFGPRR